MKVTPVFPFRVCAFLLSSVLLNAGSITQTYFGQDLLRDPAGPNSHAAQQAWLEQVSNPIVEDFESANSLNQYVTDVAFGAFTYWFPFPDQELPNALGAGVVHEGAYWMPRGSPAPDFPTSGTSFLSVHDSVLLGLNDPVNALGFFASGDTRINLPYLDINFTDGSSTRLEIPHAKENLVNLGEPSDRVPLFFFGFISETPVASVLFGTGHSPNEPQVFLDDLTVGSRVPEQLSTGASLAIAMATILMVGVAQREGKNKPRRIAKI